MYSFSIFLYGWINTAIISSSASFKNISEPKEIKMESCDSVSSSGESDDSSTSDSSSSSSKEALNVKNENQGKVSNVKRQPLVAQDKLLSLRKALK